MMVHFTVFSLATGLILRTGACPSSDAALQARTGEGVLVGERGDAASQKVELVEEEPTLVPLE